MPTFSGEEPSEKDRKKYADPFKPNMIMRKEDRSSNHAEVVELEQEFGFRFIEVVGCFNWIANTCYEEIYAIRKLCRFMSLPGRNHFVAARHLLHHFRCHPPRPLIFYRDLENFPVAKMLRKVPGMNFDLLYVVFADSSHADCDGARSTACDLHVLQGGLVDHMSWVPNVVPMSTAESENNCYSVAAMRTRFIAKAVFKILFNDPNFDYTVPICVDSQAAIQMNESDNPTRRTRHIESRYWYGRLLRERALVAYVKVDGKEEQPADIGTKITTSEGSVFYRGLFEAPYM